MRVHVALAPGELPGEGLPPQNVVVIDVFRAATTMAAALSHGCEMVIPVLTPEEARERARRFSEGQVLLGGERAGEPIPGFDLGNSPLEYTAERIAGKVVILTTTNGTRALLAAAAAGATAIAVGALVNVKAIAHWVEAQGRDLMLLCAGEGGSVSLEDTVCAGLIVDRLATGGAPLDLSDAAGVSRCVARDYRDRLGDLRTDSRWARHLTRAGREADLAACLSLDVCPLVPLLRGGAVSAA
ncbi:MAG: 2-phosphosulfolactate phosphatase [Candidatus Rokubacteria bacterium]|nr:2-phosphosulfolactate phosphatase [Candidatus Rokubacteria bacterium]